VKQVISAVIISFMATSAHANLSVQHSAYGKWTWTRAANNCTEVYDYRPDNTNIVTSGEEMGESRFTIDEKPDINGFYRMVDVVTKSNGLTGCDGSPGGTPVGATATIYLFFNATRDQMVVCQEPSFNACFGPLRRISN
jgi:hypothetical protein